MTNREQTTLTLCMLKILYAFCRLLIFFFKIFISIKDSFSNTRVSNSFDPDQLRQNVWPDLGPKLFAKVISSLQQMIKFVPSKERVISGPNNIMLLRNNQNNSKIYLLLPWSNMVSIKKHKK